MTAPRDDGLALRRADLATLTDLYRRASAGPRAWLAPVIGIAGLAIGASLVWLAEHLGWPGWTAPGFLALGWAIMLVALVASLVRARRVNARHEFHCPQCDALLLGGRGFGTQTTRAELAIASGHCPVCGAAILDEAALG